MNGYLITSVSGGQINGDWVQITSGENAAKTTYSSKGIKAANEIMIDGGTIVIRTADDGIHANAGATLDNGADGVGNIIVNGGVITVTAADDGIHADGALTINGGTVNIVESHEGLEANVITLNGGTTTG